MVAQFEFDKRITPVRPDVADKAFEGKVEARRFVHPTPYQVVRDGAPLHFIPAARSPQESQLLFGETFNVYEQKGDWCWGQNQTDNYVGYVARADLIHELDDPSHVVAALLTHRYLEADVKAPVNGQIGMGGLVEVRRQRNGFSQIRGGEWLFSHHLQALGEVESDYIATAMNFLGMPYLWGGRTARGLDCSALVQLSLARAGLRVPRDSDQQEKSLGQLVGGGTDLRDIEEGDVIFFPGHVGFVLEGFRFLHANAFDMCVSVHRLSDVLDRAKESGQWFTSIRRINQS